MRRLIHICLLVTTAILIGGCSIEPPLHLRKAVATEVELVTDLNVDLMWQTDWESLWQFEWDASVLGPLGYTVPASMRLHIYTQGPDRKPVSHTVHNFMGTSSQMEIFLGTHNLLFHNNDSEALLFRSDDDLSDIYSYTRNISNGLKDSNPVNTQQQKAAGAATRADEMKIDEPVALAPDGLFALYDRDRVITDNPDDYVYRNGKYVLLIEGTLNPLTYIYLIQVNLLNNYDRVAGSMGGAAITGMAGGVDLMTNESFTSTVSVPMDVYMDQEREMLGARVMTFGNPGCNPYDDASVAAMPEQKHYLVINVTYRNGSYRNVSVDITDQVRALPLGGVITLDLDVNDFPPDEEAGGGSGFNALISDWDEEYGETTIIN
ncbi:MAG: DUF5119 domain-containing protein [Bacteroidales bacterium]|nr:DUF5119 domain-containing protein [Bacteroidales bacterium]